MNAGTARTAETYLECGEVKPRGDDIDERHAAPDAPSGAQHPFQLHVVPAKAPQQASVEVRPLAASHSSVSESSMCRLSGPVHLRSTDGGMASETIRPYMPDQAPCLCLGERTRHRAPTARRSPAAWT